MPKSDDHEGVSVSLGLDGTLRLVTRSISVADTLALLSAIARNGSLQGVALALGLSYRAAWDRVRSLEEAIGQPVVQKTRGHGSALTPVGLALCEALADAAGGLAAPLAREARTIELRLRDVLGTTPRPLSIAVSHDLVLMETLSALPDCEVAVLGSDAAVRRLLAGEADIVGFHCGPVGLEEAGAPFAQLVGEPGLRVRPLFEREQGLLVAPGNPLGIRSLREIATERIRYVNRQRGSGTRTWFDRLLAEHGIAPSAIDGYGLEEFTHQAVAAVIATGSADAGLGARSAAERFGLHFISVGWETYYIAASASLPADRIEGLTASVAARVARSAGYKVPAALLPGL